MLIKQLSYYLTFGSSCGGKKMKFDDIYPILLTGQVVKRKSNFKGFNSEKKFLCTVAADIEAQ